MRSLLLAALLLADETAVRRSYPVSKVVNLSLDVPSSWSEALQISKSGFPPTISITAPDGSVEMLVTPVWAPKGEKNFDSPPRVRAYVESAASRVLPSATQSTLPLQTIRTKRGAGYYFWAKDRAPRPGEFEYMAQGAVPAGGSLISFTVFMHGEPPDSLSWPLQMIETADLEP
jgi:hypothetical protein